MATGLVVDATGFEVLVDDQRLGPRRILDPVAVEFLTQASARYERAVLSHASPEVFLGLGRDLYSWLDGPQGQLAGLVDQADPPVVFEVCSASRRPSLAAWALLRAPWELLAGPEGFLAADDLGRFAAVRRLGTPRAAPATDEYCLGLAFMASAPRGQRELDFEAEEMAILGAVDQTRLDLLVDDTGDPAQLGHRLADLGGMPVVHLSCHGHENYQVSPGSPGVPVLMMENETGGARATTAADLVQTLTLNPRLVFLSACLTATPAPQDSSGAEAGEHEGRVAHSLSTALITAGIPSVIGWDGSVDDQAATEFAGRLYRSLADRVDLACRRSRNSPGLNSLNSPGCGRGCGSTGSGRSLSSRRSRRGCGRGTGVGCGAGSWGRR